MGAGNGRGEMPNQYEILEETMLLDRPTHTASRAEKDLMLRELRILGSNDPDEVLSNVSQILRRPFQSLDSIRSCDAHRVIGHCQRVRHRQY